MSSEIAIDVNGVSKCYQVYQRPVQRLYQSLVPPVARLFGAAEHKFYEEFWALKDVSFELKKGESLGIIGRNGSGKSTLLQVICGTLSKTQGQVRSEGKIAALLELGSGFNPEFTGRENIYMNASLHGLTRQQIDERFQDIVKFADIGTYIDQPVKSYSSGMYVRLAFSVIAHVDAEILIIDEALAVGDAIFVQKCMRFLRAFRKQGTLLFVSHDTASVINFCDSALWIDKGQVVAYGSSKSVTEKYAQFCLQEIYGEEQKLESLKEGIGVSRPIEESCEQELSEESLGKIKVFDNLEESDGWKTDSAEIKTVILKAADGSNQSVFKGGEEVKVVVDVAVQKTLESPIIGFFVKDRLGQPLFGDHTYHADRVRSARSGEVLQASFVFTLPMLPNGDYSLTVSIGDGNPWDIIQHNWIHDAVLLKVSSAALRYGLVGIKFKEKKLVSLA